MRRHELSDEEWAVIGPGLSQIFSVNGMLTIGREIPLLLLRSVPMVLNAITEKLKRQSKDDFKGRYFEAWLIVQAVALVFALSAQLSRFGGNGPGTRFRD
ncbi:hypothetical protein RvVAT039_pl01000 (plasmid) [Agrobacterium vitis]|nr:hypothetical protein RvVAT039_pl01000 [Agrobacterium vitis]